MTITRQNPTHVIVRIPDQSICVIIRRFIKEYLAGSVDYQFPLCYPEGGISGVIYFKRIRLNVGADYARFQEFGSRGKTWRDIYSYGGDLLLDLNILRKD